MGQGQKIIRFWWCYRRLFNSHNFATPAALAEVCALLSVILVTSAMEILFSHVSICSSVNRITHKLLIKSLWHFMKWLYIIQSTRFRQ